MKNNFGVEWTNFQGEQKNKMIKNNLDWLNFVYLSHIRRIFSYVIGIYDRISIIITTLKTKIN